MLYKMQYQNKVRKSKNKLSICRQKKYDEWEKNKKTNNLLKMIKEKNYKNVAQT